MKSEITIHEYEKTDFPGAIAVIGFPSIGLVSSIAANFMIRSMGLKRVAGVISPDFPPYSLVYRSEPSPPVRIFAGERECNESGEQCEQIVVITAEFMPRPDLIKPLVDVILEWCKSKGIETIITLEGIYTGIDPSEAKALCIATGDRCKAMVEHYGLNEMKDGMVSGISGVLLYEADRLGINVMCLLGPAKINYPDARGAARLLEIIGDMFPELKLDPEPLYNEAEHIERQMKEAMESMRQPEMKSLADQSIIYR